VKAAKMCQTSKYENEYKC